MVNVINNTCEQCNKQPAYNIRGATKGRFCAEHKEPNMVNVRDTTCEQCSTRARHGLLGKAATHCAIHKQPGMICYPTRLCSAPRCRELGTHEADGSRYCDSHSPADAENLGIDTCTSCGLEDILTDGKCATCNPLIIQLRTHRKENRVKDLLHAAGFQFVHDRMLEGTSCGRERPDFQMDAGTHFVYVEVDEHQHSSYACECEQARMVNLVHVRGMPVRWVRYNPDVYEPRKGQRKATREQREKKLTEMVHWAMKHSPQEDAHLSSVLYLFYDEHDTTRMEWQTIV